MEFSELEGRVDRSLRRLPMPRAPHTLLPRVLAAAARLAQRPWYARTWFTWPRPLQGAAAVAAMLLIALAFAFSHETAAAGALVAGYVSAAAAYVPGLLQTAGAIATLVQVLSRSFLAPLAIGGLAVIVLMLLTGGACWTFVNRLTLTSERA